MKHFQAKFWWFWSLKWNLNWFKINFGFHFKLQNHQNFAYKCLKMSTMGSAFFSAAGHNGLRKFKSPLWKYLFWSQKWCISFVIYSKTIPGTKRKPNAKLKLTAFSKKKGRQTCRNSFSAVSKAMALRFCTYSALKLLCPNICTASAHSAEKLNFRARTFRPPRGRYILE